MEVLKKVHLGCGKKHFSGWINIDVDHTVNPDIVDDITNLSIIEDNSVDLIYACHVLEHIGRWKWRSVLKLWSSKLKQGGTLRISVPSFEAVVNRYNQKHNITEVSGLVCGGQRNEYDIHFIIFDKPLLTEGLIEAGLVDIKEWDWRTTEHSHIDDYSQSYLPHLDKENGMHMSLNLEGTKG